MTHPGNETEDGGFVALLVLKGCLNIFESLLSPKYIIVMKKKTGQAAHSLGVSECGLIGR